MDENEVIIPEECADHNQWIREDMIPPQEDNFTFKTVDLQAINLAPNDVLAVKLIGDDFDSDTTASLKDMLDRVFTKNKVMVFTMPTNSNILFEVIKTEQPNYCSSNDCTGKNPQNPEGEKDEYQPYCTRRT